MVLLDALLTLLARLCEAATAILELKALRERTKQDTSPRRRRPKHLRE